MQANTQDNFLNWSIPNYFIQNYLTEEFHKDCLQKQQINSNQCFKEDKFINHYQQYLNKWSIIRGKWINLFDFQQKKIIEQKICQQNNQIKQKNIKSFSELLLFLNLKHEQLYFIGFLTKFYKLACLEQTQKQKQHLVSSISKIYFQYRLQLSFMNINNISESPAITSFLKLILKSQTILNQNSSYMELKLFEKIARQCEFEHLYNQLKGNKDNINEKIATKKMELLTPIKKTNIQNQNVISKKIPSNQTTPQLNHIRNLQTNILLNNKLIEQQVNQQQKQYFQKEQIPRSKKSVLKAIQKKKQENREKAQKIVKTTRYSNFKGTFLKKPAQNINFQQIKKTQKQFCNDTGLNYKNISLNKKKATKQQESQDIYFLCDKSI